MRPLTGLGKLWDGGRGYMIRGINGGSIREHVRIAQLALGKPLPDGAQVHHVNGDRSDNRPKNLVICQDSDYHKELHRRSAVVKRGGNPNAQRLCLRCDALLPSESFKARRAKHGPAYYSRCRGCMSIINRAYNSRRRQRAG